MLFTLDYSTHAPQTPNAHPHAGLLHPHMHDLGTPYARHTPLLNIMHCLTNNDIKNILGVILGNIFQEQSAQFHCQT